MFEQLEIRARRTAFHDARRTACLVDITAQVQALLERSAIREGVCTVYVPQRCRSVTAGVTINENADPTVCTDLLRALDQIVPWRNQYEHAEGNSAAHVKASLMGASASILVRRRAGGCGQLRLGTWQGIYLLALRQAEFDGPRTRRVWVQVVAEACAHAHDR